MRTLARTLLACATFALLACGEVHPAQPDSGSFDASVDDAGTPRSDGGESGRDGGRDGGGSDAGAPDPDGGAPACSCDDGIDCTRDRCTREGCVFEPIHHRCEPGSFCGAGGCAPGAVCTTDADCPTDADACTTRMRCDVALRQCTWEILDGDGDGHAPRVCGGLDCADATPSVGPGQLEICNGVDDDCDGVVDGATTDCGEGLSCVDGACGCPGGEEFCGEALGCRVLSGDPAACGTCATACRSGGLCVAGECQCPSGATECDGACAILGSDPAHCGACGNACAPGALCTGGTCACPSDTSECSAGCVALGTDTRHCGQCDRRCIEGGACAAGGCSTAIGFLHGFQSSNSISIAGLLSHPSGELTILVQFSTTLDELPLRGIAAGSGYYLTRRSSSGAELWSRLLMMSGSFDLIGSPGREDFALSGSLSSSIDFGDGDVVSTYTGALAIVRYDADGVPVWKRIVPRLDPAWSAPGYTSAAMYTDGGVAVLATLNAPANFGGANLGSTACCTTWAIARYAAADGAHLASWELPTIGTNGVRGEILGAGPGGSVIVAGSYAGGAAIFGSITLPGPNSSYIATYEPTGAVRNAFVTTGGFRFGGATIAVADDGDIFTATTTAPLTRLAPDGMVRWSLPAVDPSAATTVSAQRVTIAPSGRVLALGTQRGGFDFGHGPLGENSSYVAEYESDGTLVLVRGFARDGDRSTMGLTHAARAASGPWIVAGGFSETVTFQDRTLLLTTSGTSPRGVFVLGFTP